MNSCVVVLVLAIIVSLKIFDKDWQMFVEKRSGEWKHLGLADNVPSS